MNKADQNSNVSKPAFSGEYRVPFTSTFKEVSRTVAKVKQKDYLAKGLHPIIDQGQTLIGGYSNAEEGLFTDVPAIVFGDHTRCVKYIEEPFFAGADGVKILKPILSGNDRYWYHALRNAHIENLGYSRHFKLLKEADFLACSDSRQAEICEVLDKTLDLIETQKEVVSILQTLVKSRFIEMFGDPAINDKGFATKPGKELFKIGNGRTLKQSRRLAHGIPAYGGNGIAWYTDEALVDSPTIVIGRVGRHCGNARLANGPMWITDNAMYITKFYSDDFDLVFLNALMEIVDFSKYADQGDLWKITQKPFMEWHYPTPPLALQQEFAAFARQAAKLEFVAQKQIEKLQLLYDSLAQEYFG